MAVEKKDIDWGSLGFAYQPTDYSYVCNYRDGAWEEGGLTTDHTLTLSECAGIFHYCQEVFEGLKAYTTKDGDIVCFRPDLNASRMADSARRIVMPPFPEDKFVEAVKMVVKANEAWVPPFGSGGTLTGLGRALKKVYPELKVVAGEPEESPLLSRGYAGAHGIQGIGANFIPDLLDKEVIDETVCVKSADAIVGATRAAKEYGTLIGISSGAALVASKLVAARNSEAVVVTLFPDTGERYLSVWES